MMELTGRRSRFIEPVIFALLALYFVANTLPAAWRTLNTDFPNYYLTARMAREHTDTARAYEWLWIEREKDHRDIDQRIVGLVPITPFSTLMVWPIATQAPLTAKHIWIAFNLGLLIGVLFMLPRVSGLSLPQAGILISLSYPLQFNFLLGQYYVLLLALLTAACWAAQRRQHVICGVLVGTAAALKIFPLILILHFLRKRDWKAAAACCITVLVSVCISISVFGIEMHRTYVRQVLPWTLRGEGLPSFHLGSSSLSTVLHRLFIYEPQWNPHPAIHAAWLFPVLHTVIQLFLLVPAVLLIAAEEASPLRTALEWSGLLMVSLITSTSPGSYLFTILILPMAVVCSLLMRRRWFGYLGVALILFFAVGRPNWHIHVREGWGTLLCVPRLYALIAVYMLVLFLLCRRMPRRRPVNQVIWASALASLALCSAIAGVRHQRGLFDDYKYRLPMPEDALLAAHPVALSNRNVAYIGLSIDGYRAAALNTPNSGEIALPASSAVDQLSLTSFGNQVWTEDVLRASEIRPADFASPAIADAESPIISANGQAVAYLRQVEGHKQLFFRQRVGGDRQQRQLTSAPFEVYEAAFLSSNELAVSATRPGSKPMLYRLNLQDALTPLVEEEARYPAASPDGHWLAFGKFVDGNWNLYLLDLQSGRTMPISHVPCNQIDPSWEPDSKTLLYASDCGRSLWFTALERRQIIP